MLTLEALREYGANVDEGLARCMNNEDFYLRLVNMAVEEEKFAQLPEAVNAGDLDRGFELAHGLKGTLGNLSLTPVFEPVSEITELLRSRTEMDYSSLLDEIKIRYEQLRALI